jgi:hypothetical protein
MKYIKLEGPWTPVPHVPHPSHQSREYTMSLIERTLELFASVHPTMGNERKKHRKEKKKPKKQKP